MLAQHSTTQHTDKQVDRLIQKNAKDMMKRTRIAAASYHPTKSDER
jgi:hypothetical protein